MANHQPYISLDSCITDYLTESEQGNHKYYKLWQLAFRGMDNMGMDFFYRVQALKLPVEDNFTVKIPAGYLQWTKVGVLNDRGGIIPLYYNNTLTTYADLLPDRLSKTQDNQLAWAQWNEQFWCNYWNGNAFTNVYGVPSGEPFVGNFKVDIDNGVILLDETFAYNYIILEYVSSPTPDKEYMIPVQFRDAMIAWLAWKDSSNVATRSHYQLGDKRDKRKDYYNERRLAIERWQPSRISEEYQASQEMSRMAIKT